MVDLTLRFAKTFKLEIICKDEDILQTFIDYLKTEKTVTRPVKRYGRMIYEQVTTEVKLFRKNKHKLTTNVGLGDYLAFHVSALCKKHDINLIFERQASAPILLSEKWKDIFSNHPRGIERGEMQISDFTKLVRTSTGIAELFTGYGKTELLLAIAECSGQRTVIIVPNNDIRDEVLSRAKNYGIDAANYDWSKTINVINVMGFMKSKNLNDEARSWLKDAKVALSDECHHAACDSYQDFFDLLENLERSHGFSASTDVADGKKVKANSVDIKKLGPTTAAVVSFCGPVRVTRTTKIPVTLTRVITHVAKASAVAAQTDWSNALDQSLIDWRMSSVISQIFEIDRKNVFFIPIHKKESGEVLYHNLIDRGYKGLLWTADNYLVNGVTKKVKNILVDMKALMKKEHFDFVMSTKLEGIDLPNLNAVIPLVGANYRMVVQPIGRSARGEEIWIFLVYDRNNPITISQANIRLERIEQEYNIVRKQNLNIEP